MDYRNSTEVEWKILQGQINNVPSDMFTANARVHGSTRLSILFLLLFNLLVLPMTVALIVSYFPKQGLGKKISFRNILRYEQIHLLKEVLQKIL